MGIGRLYQSNRTDGGPHAALLMRAPHRSVPAVFGVAVRATVLVAVVAGVLYARHALFGDSAHRREHVQRVSLVNAPRATPKPPEKPPEPAREPERLREETSAAPPPPGAPPPPSPHLGLDADAQGAGDGFGLVARRGGRDLTTLGNAEPGAAGVAIGAPAAPVASSFEHYAYANAVLQRLRSDLAAQPALRKGSYVAVVRLWIDNRGRIVRTELDAGSGSPAVDSALREAFAAANALPEPPASLPQPLRFRVTSREFDAGGS
jgi:protein TonB